MNRLPKIIKNDKGYLTVLVTDNFEILKDTELTIVNNIGTKGHALVTCTFMADLSDYDPNDVNYLKSQISDLKDVILNKDNHIKQLNESIENSSKFIEEHFYNKHKGIKTRNWLKWLFKL